MSHRRVALICHTPQGQVPHWDLLFERQPGSELCATWRLDQPCHTGQGIATTVRLFDHRRFYLELDSEVTSDNIGRVKPEASGDILDVDDFDEPSHVVVRWSHGEWSKLLFLNHELHYERLVQADQTSDAK